MNAYNFFFSFRLYTVVFRISAVEYWNVIIVFLLAVISWYGNKEYQKHLVQRLHRISDSNPDFLS